MFSTLPILYSLFAAAQPAQTQLNVQGCDLGEHYVFEVATCQIALENHGENVVKITRAVPDGPGDSCEWAGKEIPPHSSAYVEAKIALRNDLGLQRHGCRIYTDESGHPETRAHVRAFAMSALDEQPKIDFGLVDLSSETPQKSVALSSHDVANFHVQKVLSKPSWLDVSLDGNVLTTKIRADGSIGLYGDFVKLAINAPRQREAWIAVNADLRGDVVPSANPLSIGLIRTSDSKEFRITLNNRRDKAFSVGTVELGNLDGEVKVENCIPEKPSCRWLTLRLSKDLPLGTIKGDIYVALPDTKQKLKISVRGLLVDKDFKIRTLEPPSAEEKASTSTTAKTLDVERAIRNAVEHNVEPSLPGHGPLLQWTIADGQLIHGFQIFRSASADGSFTVLNQQTIPNKAEDAGPVSYEYRDNAAEPGKAYWYYIGIVYSDGHKQQLTSPQKVIAK